MPNQNSDRRLRIRLVAPVWYPVPPVGYGGVELVVAVLAREFMRRGHQVTVVAHGDSDPHGTLMPTLTSTPEHGLIGNSWHETYHALRAYADVADADIIHDHSGIVGPALASRDRSLPPVVHTLHGPWTREARRLYRLLDHRVHLVAISESQRAENRDVRYAGTVYNGIDVDAHPLGAGPRGDSLVFIGRANPEKNPAGAIRVARASGRPLTLVIKCHEPAERDYWNQVVARLLGADIEVLEDIDHDTKVRVLQAAYAMVFPIQWPEPFGLVMVEAMACGTPVIATPCGAARELIEPGRSGYLCFSDADMAQAVQRVSALDRTQCRQHVIDRFSARTMARGYEHLFRQLQESERRRPAVSRLPPSADVTAFELTNRWVETNTTVW
jgi:glycosyltransferase involved in cell wall biosynthesis